MVGMYHDQELEEMSWMVVNGKMLKKLDLIGVVSIYGEEYFTVYRRYNNVYEIVIRDYNNDIYVRKDEPIYRSLQDILCLSDEQMENIYTKNATTFKYNMELPESMNHLEEMMWSEVQTNWYGLVMNVGGILDEYYNQKKRRQDNKSELNDSEEDSDHSDNEEGELKEMNKVEEVVEENSNHLDESFINFSSIKPNDEHTHHSLSTPTKLYKNPIIPYAPKKHFTYVSRSKKDNNDVMTDEAANVLLFLSGSSEMNQIVYPDNKKYVDNYSNKRKLLDESNDSDSVKKEVAEEDDEGFSCDKLKKHSMKLRNPRKSRKLDH